MRRTKKPSLNLKIYLVLLLLINALSEKALKVLGIGRGSNILSKINKWVDRSVRYTLNASIIDSIVQSVKALDVLYLKDNGEALPQETIGEIDYASDKQKSYLRELIRSNVFDESKRKYWESQIDLLTKDEASEKIQSFVNK